MKQLIEEFTNNFNAFKEKYENIKEEVSKSHEPDSKINKIIENVDEMIFQISADEKEKIIEYKRSDGVFKEEEKNLKKKIKELQKKIKEKEIIIQNISTSIPEIRFWKLFSPKKYDEALRSSYEIMQMVMDNIPEYIFWKDTDLVYLGCNRNYAELIGAENQQDVIGETDFEFFDDKKKVKHIQDREKNIIKLNKAEYDNIEEWSLQNGKKLLLDTNRIPLCNSKGEAVGILVTYDDITDKVKAEEELIESEEKFRTIAEKSFIGIIILQNGSFKYLNNAISKITEIPIESLLNRSFNNLKLVVHPDDLSSALKLTKLRRTNEKDVIKTSSFKLITKSGKEKWIEAYSKTILYKSHKAKLIIMYDITEKKEVESLIVEENLKLLELDNMRKELITRISHELKTPLISIYSGSEMLLNFYASQFNNKALEIIEMIYRGGRRLRELIDKLLDISQIEYGKLELTKIRENLVNIINESIIDMTYLASKRDILIHTDLPKEFYFEFDKSRITQVLTNLISNAIKNTFPRGNIYISLREYENYFEISIKDTGVGFTEKEMDKIFKKFGKIERYGKGMDVEIGGTGLGLYLSKEIIELHGGKISVESDGRNKGSTFTIKLFKIDF